MPRGSPFTQMCRQIAEARFGPTADLHAHTTASDGDWSPSQLAMEARRVNLKFLAVTDHDTIAGVQPAMQAAVGSRLTVIPGVEYSAEFAERELHVVGLWIDPHSQPLLDALAEVQHRRRVRFRALVEALAAGGVHFIPGLVEAKMAAHASIGRRHLGLLLVQTNQAANVRDAFQRFIQPATAAIEVHHRTPLKQVCETIHAAGGIAILAHPPGTFGESELLDLQQLGIDGVECHFGRADPSRTSELRALAAKLNLMVSGGSDCHGPEPADRRVGTFGLKSTDTDALIAHASGSARSPSSR